MIGRLTLALAVPLLGVAPVLGQTAPAELPALPSVQLVSPTPTPNGLPPLDAVLPPTGEQVAATQPIDDTAARDARVAALRARFEDLRRREAQRQSRDLPATSDTLAQIARLDEQVAAAEGELPLLTWKAENMAILARAMSERPETTLPASIVPGITPDIALAVIRAQTTLYAEPRTEAESVMRTLDAVTTMLRVAEVGPFTLVWSPQDRFAFILSQFREVY